MQCEVVRGGGLWRQARCTSSDTRRYMVGCIHEHIREVWACQPHATDPFLSCRLCGDHETAPHECAVKFLELSAGAPDG